MFDSDKGPCPICGNTDNSPASAADKAAPKSMDDTLVAMGKLMSIIKQRALEPEDEESGEMLSGPNAESTPEQCGRRSGPD